MFAANPKVTAFIARQSKWAEEFKKLRAIIQDCGLGEELKWGVPCYTVNDGNVVLMHGFKEYCALLFVKGALLKDLKGLLVTQTENVQSARQIRFTSLEQIEELEPVLKAYIHEAVEVEKAGLKVELKPTSEFHMPEELRKKLDEDPVLKNAFETLTPGRQRAYLLYFAAPKQAKTREARIDKYRPHILNGKGLNDD